MKGFGWETRDERLRRTMRIPPEKKLDWLEEMHELKTKHVSRRTTAIWWRLRRLGRE